MIRVRLVTCDADRCESYVDVWQDGLYWAAGTVIDALVSHQSGEKPLGRIEIDPDAEMPSLQGQRS